MAALIMGFGGNAKHQHAYTGIQLQTSAQGLAVPVYYGTSRQAANLIWYNGFTATKVNSGGKGGLGAAAGKGTGNQYSYKANGIFGVCEGPIQGYGQVWASKTPTTLSALGLTSFLGTYPQTPWGFVTTNYPTEARPYTGLAYLAASNYHLGSMAELPQHTLEVYGFFSQRSVYTTASIPGSGPFTITVGNRTWADGSTNSMWVANVSIPGFTATGGAPGLGQYKVAAGVYTFNSGNAGQSVTIQWTGKGQDADPSLIVNDALTSVNYGIGFPSTRVGELTTYTETDAIPGGAHQIAVANAATFDDNLSVYHSSTDTLFTCVASSPGPLQYSYAAGVYTFNVADLAKNVDISYCALAGLSTYQAYCWAAGLFISPAYRQQQAGSSLLDEVGNLTNSEVVFSAGALKLVPRGDTSLTGNGFTYTAPSATVYDFTDDQLMANTGSGGASGAVSGSDPIVLTRKRASQQRNVVQLECLDRSNQYNTAVVEATDQAMVDAYGRRTTGSIAGHVFCDTTAARQSVQLLLQKEAVRNTFAFVLPATFIYLDPMDIVSLTDTRLGLSSADWQRITSIEEQTDGSLLVTCEEYATGHGNAGSYSFGQGAGYAANYNVDPGAISTPIVFEPPVQLATNSGLEMWGAFSGANANWGGCDVYVSSDNVTYNFVGRKWGPSRQGVLTGSFSAGVAFAGANDSYRIQRTRQIGDFATLPSRFTSVNNALGATGSFPNLRVEGRVLSNWTGGGPPSGPDPDTVHTVHVDLTESFGALVAGTTADADAGNTACIVDSEIFSFTAANLTASYSYDLGGYLRRGQFGTSAANHVAGSLFARLDEAIFSFPYDKGQVGNTIYVKACSFNLWGGGLQDLSVVTAYPHVIIGPPTPGVVQNFAALQNGVSVVLSWTDLNDVSVKGYDILYGPQGGTVGTALLLTQASRTTETTTAAVGPGSWTFYIRARNIADQTGPVSQVNVGISTFSQTFDASGTWTKPGGVSATALVFVECWGGGGSGPPGVVVHGGGGGGGAYASAFFPITQLGATEAAVVGAGGTIGNPGGISTFGAWLSGYGGGASNATQPGGGGGGPFSNGDSSGNGGGPGGGSSGNPGGDSAEGGGGGGTNAANGGSSSRGGGGGGGGTNAGNGGNGGNSVYGGGGGGAHGTTGGGTGGTSLLGGAGGDDGLPGQVPGGGGGYGGAGARGRVRVTVLP